MRWGVCGHGFLGVVLAAMAAVAAWPVAAVPAVAALLLYRLTVKGDL